MTMLIRHIMLAGATALGLAMIAGPASAQPAQGCTSPPGMNYMICNGQRVPKPGNRVTAPDGSWREERREGNCIVVREKSATGEYKESRRCD